MNDEINRLVARCRAVVQRAERQQQATFDDVAIQFDLLPSGEFTWYVSFYEHIYGKHNATGETLTAALQAWLGKYEDYDWRDPDEFDQ